MALCKMGEKTFLDKDLLIFNQEKKHSSYTEFKGQTLSGG